MVKRVFNIILLILCLFVTLLQGSAIPIGDFDIIPGLRLWGLDVEFDYNGLKLIRPLNTTLMLSVGGGYEGSGLYRENDETLYTPPKNGSTNLGSYSLLNYDWFAGIRQAIMPDERDNSNLLEVYLAYRGAYDDNDENSAPGALHFVSTRTDRNTIFQNSIVGGIRYSSVMIDPVYKSYEGVAADLTAEWAPDFFFNEQSDYWRFNLDLRGYLPLLNLDSPGQDRNGFNIYMADRIFFDYITGPEIPVNARRTVINGSIKAGAALGYALRGIDIYRFDGYIKIVNNFDIRMILPTIRLTPVPDIVPGLVVYFDAGMFDNMTYSLDFAFDDLLVSTGFGVFINLIGFDIIAYANYFISENRFSFGYDFILHF